MQRQRDMRFCELQGMVLLERSQDTSYTKTAGSLRQPCKETKWKVCLNHPQSSQPRCQTQGRKTITSAQPK